MQPSELLLARINGTDLSPLEINRLIYDYFEDHEHDEVNLRHMILILRFMGFYELYYETDVSIPIENIDQALDYAAGLHRCSREEIEDHLVLLNDYRQNGVKKNMFGHLLVFLRFSAESQLVCRLFRNIKPSLLTYSIECVTNGSKTQVAMLQMKNIVDRISQDDQLSWLSKQTLFKLLANYERFLAEA